MEIKELGLHKRYLSRSLTDLEEKKYLKHIKICVHCAKELLKSDKEKIVEKTEGKK